ncbi:MAG: RNA-binding S4 domain-containing protein [Pseudomonadota bacterium]
MSEARPERLRIDKWLWFARVVKSRTLAAKLVQDGKVRINREKVASASRTIKIGDVLTIAVHNKIRILKVQAIGSRRGPASEAALLYDDLSPPPLATALQKMSDARPPAPEKRPDKRARRELSRLKGRFNSLSDNTEK